MSVKAFVPLDLAVAGTLREEANSVEILLLAMVRRYGSYEIPLEWLREAQADDNSKALEARVEGETLIVRIRKKPITCPECHGVGVVHR